MPLFFLLIAVAAVAAMGATQVATAKQLPEGSPLTVSMNPGEVWSVSATIARDMSELDWVTFHDKLTQIMSQLGARIGKLDYAGRSFTFQIQPTTQVMKIQVPMVDPEFTITKADRVPGITQISGRYRRLV